MIISDRMNVLIIGAGDFQIPLINRASEQYNVFLAAPIIGNEIKNKLAGFLETDVRDKDKILEYARSNKIDGVITDQTDIPVRTVAYVAEKMNLPGIGYETSILFTDKAEMRKKLIAGGIPVLPNATVASLNEAEDFFRSLNDSVIIKPCDMQGSRGVMRCDSIDELRSKYSECRKWSSDGNIVIEKLARGREFVVEGLAFNFEFSNLICGDTDYFNIPDAYAAKSRIFPSEADSELVERVCNLNTNIIKTFGLKQGITHSEFIMDGEEIYLIETAARGGGVFISSDLISLSTELNTEEFLLNIALGKQEAFPDIQNRNGCCGYLALFIPKGKVISVKGVDEIKSLPYIHHNQLDKLKVGLKNEKGNTDKTSRLAMIVSADNRQQYNERVNYIKTALSADVLTEDGIQGIVWD